MKKITMTLCILALITGLGTGCGQTSADNISPAESIPNPVHETDEDGIRQAIGVSFGMPEGVENVKYYMIDDEIAEMRFEKGGTEFTARIKPSAEFEDISGMYYEWTATDDSGKVKYCDAREMSYISETEDDVMVALWYDAAPGLMYSLSAVSADLNGLDLLVYADQVFDPMQGDSDGTAPEAAMGNTEIDAGLLIGEWSLPGSNRLYMEFSDSGTVFGYEYNDNKYDVEGDTLRIYDTPYNGTDPDTVSARISDGYGIGSERTNSDNKLSLLKEEYKIVTLDENWLGLLFSEGDEPVYSYRSDSPQWKADDALIDNDGGAWVITDFSKVADDEFFGGLSFSEYDGKVYFSCYYGEPDIGTASWSMSATAMPGAVIAEDGTIRIYVEPESFTEWKYSIDDGGTLHITDETGREYDFEKKQDS